MVQLMSDKSGLKTRSLGLNTLGTAKSPASSQYILVSNLFWKIVMGPQFKITSKKTREPLDRTDSPCFTEASTEHEILPAYK